MDRLQSMRVFQRVVYEGSFAAAARALDMSPAGVTRLVGDLEQHLGVRLLQRTTRHLVLTDAGKGYLNKLRHILSDIDEADAGARKNTQEISGVLRILVPPVMATHILAPIVAEFNRRYPRVKLDVCVDSFSDPPIEDYDLTLLSVDGSYDADVVARPLTSSQGMICAAPDYLERYGVPSTPSELPQHKCLRIKLPGNHPHIWQLSNPKGGDLKLEVVVEPAFVVNDADTLLSATLYGAGISGLPLDLVATYLKSGQLTRILAPWVTGLYTLYAALPSRKFMPARTRAFLDLITEHARAAADEAARHRQLVRSGSGGGH
jgi:DNA-binding transcriptional LysR family regulator